MTKQIFKTDQKPAGPAYMIADDDSQFNDDDFVVGEPMYNEANTPQYQYPKLNEKS